VSGYLFGLFDLPIEITFQSGGDGLRFDQALGLRDFGICLSAFFIFEHELAHYGGRTCFHAGLRLVEYEDRSMLLLALFVSFRELLAEHFRHELCDVGWIELGKLCVEKF